MRILLLLGIFLILLPCASRAQYILQLKNRKNGKVYERYHPGHTISFRLVGFPAETWGKIDSIGRDTFFIGDIPYPISSIERITVNAGNCNWRVHGGRLMVAGVALIGIEAFNSTNIDNKLFVSNQSIIVGAVLFTTGYILYRTHKRTYYLGGKYYLKTI